MIRSTFIKFLPFMLIVGLVVCFFAEVVFQNNTFMSSGLVLSDLYLFNYPLKSLLHSSLQSGQGIPLWTDLIGNGYPIFAEGQMGSVYPLHLLFFSLPISTIAAFNINLILHYILSITFSFIYIQKYIKVSKYASMLGAAVVTFSGYMLTHLHQVNIVLVITYLPLNFYLIEKIFELNSQTKFRFKLLTIIVFSLSLYAQITAGHIEMVYYNLLFTAAYAILRLLIDPATRTQLIQKILMCLLAGIISILLALPQILATYELVNFSQREEGLSYEHSTGALWPLETLSLFINPKAFDVYRKEPGYTPLKPDTINIGAVYPYVGIIPLILAVIAIASLFFKKSGGGHSKRKMWILLYTFLLVLTYMYAVGRSTQLFAVIWETVPGLKYFRFPIKALYVIEFCIAILGAIGMQEIYDIIVLKTKNKSTKNNQNAAITTKNTGNSSTEDNRSNGEFAGKNIIALVVSIVLIALTYADLWINNRPIQPTIPSEDWLQTPEFAQYIKDREKEESQNNFVNWRSYSHGTNNIDYARIFDFTLQKELRNILHIDFNMIHGVAMNREWAVLFLQRQTLLNKFNTGIDFERGELTLPDTLKKSLDLQSVKFLLSDIPIIHPDIVKVKEITLTKPVDHVIYLAGSTDAKYIPITKLYMYENKTYYPRINLTPASAVQVISPQDKTASNVLQAVLTPEFNPSQHTIIEEPLNLATGANTDDQLDTYEVTSYQPAKFELKITTNAPTVLSIQDTYYPGWKAYVDGKETPIYKANYAFRAISIPAGTHQIQMKFEPDYLNNGGIVQKVGWGILGLLSVVYIVLRSTTQLPNKE